MRHSVFGETPMGPEWGTNCTIGVPTVDACVNASLVEVTGRVEGNLDAGKRTHSIARRGQSRCWCLPLPHCSCLSTAPPSPLCSSLSSPDCRLHVHSTDLMARARTHEHLA